MNHPDNMEEWTDDDRKRLYSRFRGRAGAKRYSAEVRACIVFLYIYFKSRKKKGRDNDYRGKVSKALQISETVVRDTWKYWKAHKDVQDVSLGGNYSNHPLKLLQDPTVLLQPIRALLRDKHKKLEYVRAPQIRAHLATLGLIPEDPKDGFSLRTLQRYLKEYVYLYLKRSISIRLRRRCRM